MAVLGWLAGFAAAVLSCLFSVPETPPQAARKAPAEVTAPMAPSRRTNSRREWWSPSSRRSTTRSSDSGDCDNFGLLGDDERVVRLPAHDDLTAGPEGLEPAAGVLRDDGQVRPVGADDVLRHDAEVAGVRDVPAQDVAGRRGGLGGREAELLRAERRADAPRRRPPHAGRRGRGGGGGPRA